MSRLKPVPRQIQPIILAAGPSRALPFPKALAPFGLQTALERAVECCRKIPELAPPIVVLGCQGQRVLRTWRRRAAVPFPGVRFVLNRNWRRGQLSSLLAGLHRMPAGSPGFLIYPVDYPLLTPRLLIRLVGKFQRQAHARVLVAPSVGRRTGHPVLASRQLSREFLQAGRHGGTARDVIYRSAKPQRLVRVAVRDSAIFRDFDSLYSYRRCLRLLVGRKRA